MDAGRLREACRVPPVIVPEPNLPRRVIAAAPRIGIHTLTLFAPFLAELEASRCRDPGDLAAASRIPSYGNDALSSTKECGSA